MIIPANRSIGFPEPLRKLSAALVSVALAVPPLCAHLGPQPAAPAAERERASSARPDAVSGSSKTKKSGDRLSKAFKGRLPITDLNEGEAILHALNRLGYGPRPGDVERVRAMGLERWVDQQLHPATIEDSAVEARLAVYPTISMTSSALITEYPTPEMAAKRMGIGVEEYRKRMEEANRRPQGAPPAADKRPQRVLDELGLAKLTRAIYSERQLEEQMVDFWFNHFNVFAGKDNARWLVGPYERDVLRSHAFGRFRDLLEATAKSPAMLYYLDNWVSADPKAFDRLKRQPAPRTQAPSNQLPPVGGKRGLNENYGRELLELHTLGVDGGYTQKDVTETARCFTGWTIRALQTNPEFYFDERVHDPEEKIVLGKKIKAGGMEDGEKILDMLVKHPSTARFISTKLARHFVSDNPSPALVGRMAKTFRKSNGDIRAVLQTMIYSSEFWSRQAYRAKVKSPLELVASSARALGMDVDAPAQLTQWVARIGEPLYLCLPPTGYADRAEAWVNTGALLNRLNFAVALASSKIRGTSLELAALVGEDVATNPKTALDRAIEEFLAGQVSPETRETLERKSAEPQVLHAKPDDPVEQVDLGVLTGLVLGTPEFQRR